MTTQLREAIARIRTRSKPLAADLVLVCDALEDKLCCEALMAEAAPKFDKVAYQREYMRRRRAEKKLLKSLMELDEINDPFTIWSKENLAR